MTNLDALAIAPEIAVTAAGGQLSVLWYDGDVGSGWPEQPDVATFYSDPIMARVDGSSSDVIGPDSPPRSDFETASLASPWRLVGCARSLLAGWKTSLFSCTWNINICWNC